MTLDALANEIAAQAKAEAESIIATAKQQAKQIEDEAKAEADIFSSDVKARAERESAQLSVVVVASAKQANQNATAKLRHHYRMKVEAASGWTSCCFNQFLKHNSGF